MLRRSILVEGRKLLAGALPIESVSLSEFGSGRITKRNAAGNQPVFVSLSVQILAEIGMRE